MSYVSHEVNAGFMLTCNIPTIYINIVYRYARMPVELLPTVISSLRAKVEEGFSSITDQIGLLVSLCSYVIIGVIHDYYIILLHTLTGWCC